VSRRGGGLQAELTEGDLGAARGDAGVAALLLLAVLGACGLEHSYPFRVYSFLSPSGLGGFVFTTFLGRFTVVLARVRLLSRRSACRRLHAAGAGRAFTSLGPGRGAGFFARLGLGGRLRLGHCRRRARQDRRQLALGSTSPL